MASFPGVVVSKISNLHICGPNPPTSQTNRTDRQTDRRMDDMKSQYRALCTIVHRAVKMEKKTTLYISVGSYGALGHVPPQLPTV